jgi:hypothetical protein
MMNIESTCGRAALLILLLALLTSATAFASGTAKPPLRFFVVGDAPYAAAEFTPLSRLLDVAGGLAPAFIVHVGDIKGGRQPCSDSRNERIASLFRSQQVPVLYTPGDNEWTDCHRRAAGGRDPLERLAALRQQFFGDPAVLHNQSLGLVVPDPRFPENAYLIQDQVIFVLVHVVGSKNNRRPKVASAMREWRQRSAANRALIEAAAAAAKDAEARAMVLFFHANPLFETAEPGFRPFLEDLSWLLEQFPGPVLAVHGDTHRFRFDQPLADRDNAGEASQRLWRLEVPGSPLLGGVWVTVNNDREPPFKIEVVYPRADEAR